MTVEVNHEIYSSAAELGGIQVEDQPKEMDRPSFIRMDPPQAHPAAPGGGARSWPPTT